MAVDSGTTWLVTGGAGLLGQHVVRAARDAGVQLAAPTSSELDVRSTPDVDAAIDALRPAAVLHLAYRKDARGVIVDGSANVARAAARHGARLVHLSTDAVFAGRPEPYVEADHATPVTNYGRWKAEAEGAVRAIDASAVLVRTSLMYRIDEPAPCQRDVIDALEGRSSMRFFTDEVRCFSAVDDVAAAVVHLASAPEVSGPLHVACPDPLDRATFARHVARWWGLDPDLVPTATIAESGMDRPARVVLDTTTARDLGLRCRTVTEALVRSHSS